jgi:hypothetical protein
MLLVNVSERGRMRRQKAGDGRQEAEAGGGRQEAGGGSFCTQRYGLRLVMGCNSRRCL